MTTSPDQTETATAEAFRLKRRAYGYSDQDFALYFHHDPKVLKHVPNVEPMDLQKALASTFFMEIGGPKFPLFCALPDRPNMVLRARYFPTMTQAGRYDGSGIFIAYEQHDKVIAGRFAICRHQARSLDGARPSIGWHPAECEICGMDLSVDSGD